MFIGTVPVHAGAGASTFAANARLKRLLGVPEHTPDADVDPFAPDRFADPAARGPFLAALARNGSVTDYPLRLRRSDGSTLWVEVSGRAEPDSAPGAGASSGGGALRLEALVRDVNERRREDEHSRGLYQQLQQADKMAALGQTISGVAHELNNPLTTILSWAERLAERSTDDTARRGIDVIRNEAERAARIVRNLLTFAHKRVSTRSAVDINLVVRDTLALRAEAQKRGHIDVATALAAGLPDVFADAHQSQQVLLNLLINAEQSLAAAGHAGSIVVRTLHDPARESVVLEVSDDGPGVPESARARVFDPFFTTKEVGKGTGLGLTVAYAIVQEHGGRIRLESPPSGGATFIVELPLGAATPTRQPGHVSGPWDAVRGASVLLVEDEPELAAAVAEALNEAGLNVDHAGDGQEALARVRQFSYDLVVCDLKMPRADGMMLYRAIAAATPALARRVIFVTGEVAATDAERLLEDSGCRWLTKPFRLGDLMRAIRDTVG